MEEFPKIYAPFNRYVEGEMRNKLIDGEWSSSTLEYLAETQWIFTEKVDGTNIRVHWDGHKVTFGGRTESAQIPAKLVAKLLDLFPEELFEQTFGADEVTLFGEGYGAGIQKGGGNYSSTQEFVLFDVLVGQWWLERPNVENVAKKLGVDVVPIVLNGTIRDAINVVRSGLQSLWGSFQAEGLVGVPAVGLFDRAGRRIMVKIKTKDFT